MSRTTVGVCRAALAVVVLAIGAQAFATEIGRIKVAKGQVTIEREGSIVPGAVGTRVRTSDTIRTGDDGSVGITIDDDSLLSAGPNSVITLERYSFDSTTNQGRFDAALNKGTLSVISGRIAKQSSDAMTVRTPTIILGVRGTSFSVSVDE